MITKKKHHIQCYPPKTCDNSTIQSAPHRRKIIIKILLLYNSIGHSYKKFSMEFLTDGRNHEFSHIRILRADSELHCNLIRECKLRPGQNFFATSEHSGQQKSVLGCSRLDAIGSFWRFQTQESDETLNGSFEGCNSCAQSEDLLVCDEISSFRGVPSAREVDATSTDATYLVPDCYLQIFQL